jgi:drug/metabolite transporter (DMT)-like permease
VLITVALTVYGQFVIKYQVLKAGSMPDGSLERLQFVLKLMLDPWIVSAFAAAVLASLAWMAAMTRLPLSEAYPLTSITFLCVVFGGAWLFAEPLPPQRVIGALLVVIGLVVGSRS